MDLWIRSQDKTTLIKSYEIYISEQQNKYLIRAKRTSHILGSYNTIERALDVMNEINNYKDKIEKAHFLGMTESEFVSSTFQMPEE